MIWEACIKHLLHTEVWRLFQGKALVPLSDLAMLSWNSIFTWKNNWQMKGSFRLGYLIDIFLKVNEVSLSLEKKLIAFVSIKLELSNKNLNVGKLVSATMSIMSMTSSQFLKTFVMRWVVILKNVLFDNIWKVSAFEYLYNLMKQYFPNDQCMMSQSNT